MGHDHLITLERNIEPKMLSKTCAISKLSLRAVRATGAFSAGSRLIEAQSRSMSLSHEQAALGPKSVELVQTEEQFAAHNYHPLPVVFSEGHGVRVTYVQITRLFSLFWTNRLLRHPSNCPPHFFSVSPFKVTPTARSTMTSSLHTLR